MSIGDVGDGDGCGLLHALRGTRTAQLKTVGRRSGKERSAEIWFVAEGDAVVVQAGPKAEKGWYANLLHRPEVTIHIAGRPFSGRAAPVTDAAEARRLLALFRRKYWLARLAPWVGLPLGRGKPVVIRLDLGR